MKILTKYASSPSLAMATQAIAKFYVCTVEDVKLTEYPIGQRITFSVQIRGEGVALIVKKQAGRYIFGVPDVAPVFESQNLSLFGEIGHD
jgi:hypothetical protein